MSLPGPMKEIMRLADQMPDEAVLAAAAEMKREWPSQATLKELSDYVQSDPAIVKWDAELLKYLAAWVEKRFGPMKDWVRLEDDGKAIEMYVRPVFQGACHAAMAYAADAISVEAYKDACRPWMAGLEVAA